MTDDKEKAELVTEVQEDAIQKDKSRRIVLSQTLTVDKQVLPAKKETYRAADGFIELVDVNGKKASGGKIPLAIKPGDTLDVEVEFGEKQKMRVEVGVLEDVTVPAGKYKALPITVTIKEGEKTKVMSKMWVAENVGVVKMDSDGAVRELRLLPRERTSDLRATVSALNLSGFGCSNLDSWKQG